MFFKSVVFFTLIYICCDLFECINIERYDVHRILLKARNRGRYKKTPFHSLYAPHQRQLKQPYLTKHNQHWKPHKIKEDVLTNFSRIHRSNYKGHNRFKKHNHSHINPETVTQNSLNYLRNSKYNLYNEPQIKFLNPGNTQEPNYRAFRRFKGILNYYNAKEEEQYRKRIQQAKQQEAHAWNTFNEPLSQEETSNYNVWESPKLNKFKLTWKPISETKKTRINLAKSVKNGFGKQFEDLAYTVVLTTSKPQILPATIVEKDDINDIYPIQKSPEVLQDDSHTSYEISEDANTISPIMANFQNISYSTLWNQVRSKALDTEKKHTNNVQENSMRLEIKKPMYSTIYHNY